MPKFVLVFFILLAIALPTYAEAPLLISEVQISGDHSTDDYIKIYNNTENPLDLFNYILIKRTANTPTDIIIKSCWDSPNPLISKGFYLWANSDNDFAVSINANCSSTSTISTNNTVAIRQKNTGEIIDSVSWGTTNNGIIANRTSTKSSGKIIFFTPPTDNPPADNPPAASSGGGGGTAYCQPTAGEVVINELLAAPSEDENEWVELYNNCSLPVQLTDWTLEDGTGGITKLSGILDKFLVIDSPKGVLNNTGDLLILKNTSGTIIDRVLYGTWQEEKGVGAPAVGQTLGRRQDGLDTNDDQADFAISIKPSKGAANIIEPTGDDQQAPSTSTASSTGALLINEILPNPVGADEPADGGGEFIELFNQTKQTLNLSGWRLINDESQEFILPALELPAETLMVFWRSQSKLILKNDRGQLKLYPPAKTTASQTISWQTAPEGLSFNRLTGAWRWSLTPTPGATNQLLAPNQPPQPFFYAPSSAALGEKIIFDASDSFDSNQTPLNFLWDFGDGATSKLKTAEHIFIKSGSLTIKLIASDGELTASQTKTIKIIDPRHPASDNQETPVLATAQPGAVVEQKNTGFSLSGIVVAEPGVFGSQYFYILPLDEAKQTAATVVQIYNYKKDFPELTLGDLIEAHGELYNISTDTRLKTVSADDIVVLEHDYSLVEKMVESGQVKAPLINQIITISGQLLQKKSNNFFLDDGTGEVLVELKSGTGLTTKELAVGQNYQVSGLLRQSGEILKLWPRSAADITPVETTAVLGEKIATTSPVASASSASVAIADNGRRQEFLQYLLVVAAGIILGLLILLFKTGGSKKIDKNPTPQ